jgi:nitrite reductase/ring-hydroxylating ferredoxin subunit
VTQPDLQRSDPDALASVGVYRREVRASLGRIWENVLDWEHLPWLHRESFSGIDLLEAGSEGWRAQVGLASAPAQQILLEVSLERPALRYVARTLEGPGRGTEIWTQLRPLSPDRTLIEVDFRLPGLRPEQRGPLGRAYQKLYALLWDQDESMMERREARLAARPAAAAPGALPLGPLAALRARLPLAVEVGGRGFRVVELEGELLAHATECPHRLGPLEQAALEAGCLRCPWHGYRFDLRSGRSADGRRLRLAPAPRVWIDPVSSEVELRFGEPQGGAPGIRTR